MHQLDKICTNIKERHLGVMAREEAQRHESPTELDRNRNELI
jgi:hypothetical protein